MPKATEVSTWDSGYAGVGYQQVHWFSFAFLLSSSHGVLAKIQ